MNRRPASADSEVSADRGSLTATHDAAGNLLTRSDARGIVESHTYDTLNRPLTVSYPTTGENLAYTWDSAAGCTHGIVHRLVAEALEEFLKFLFRFETGVVRAYD